ncbi:MAG TPA: MarR family transcriptional regulator [Pseudolysinimonas sp.]|jgi:DNA-binding MarR family transcriptional regulator
MTDSPPSVPLAMLAARVWRISEADFFARLTESGHSELRMRHPLVLQALEPDGARARTLADRLGVSQQAVAELIDELEGRGYVERHPDPTDRRARLVVLTAKGTSALREAAAIIDQMEREYARRVGLDDYSTARAVMTRLIEQLDEAEPN